MEMAKPGAVCGQKQRGGGAAVSKSVAKLKESLPPPPGVVNKSLSQIYKLNNEGRNFIYGCMHVMYDCTNANDVECGLIT